MRHLLSCVLCLFVLVPAWPQVNTADVVGTVTDESGAVLPGVTITVENLATKVVRTTLSDTTGNYLMALLPVGRYTLRVEQTGFRGWSVPEIVLAAGDRLRVDVRLEVGQLEQTVEVQSQAPALQSDSSSLGSLVNERAVQDLPLNGRNFIRLAQAAAGANESVPNALSSGNRPDDRRRTSSVAVNGQRDFVNNFLVDGMDNNERSIGTVVVKPAMDALAEFKVQTNLYSAELGRTAGGVINLVTKSGANEYHGSLFEFFRNDIFDAKNFFSPPGPAPKFRQNQFGGSLGGPINQNRTFFFGDYEGFRQRQGQVFVSTVPTAEMRLGNFAGINPIFDPMTLRTDPNNPAVSIRDRFPGDVIPANRLEPIAVRLLTLYPQPQRPGLANNFTHAPVKKQRDDTFDIRIDHRFSERDSFYGRYSFNDTDTFTPPHLPAVGDIEAGGDRFQFSGPALQRSQGLHMNYVHTFRPDLLAEFKAGFVRFAISSLTPNYGKDVSEQFGIRGANFDINSSGLTPMTIAGFRGIGDSNFVPLIGFNNIFQYVGSVTHIRSGHSIKTGADFRRRQFTLFQGPQPRGDFEFNANFTNDPSGAVAGSGNSMASFLLGLPALTTRGNHLVWPGMRTWELAIYLQDDWRVARWLTLNLGVRYEVFTPLVEVADRISNPDLAAGRILEAGKNGVSRSAGVATDRNDLAPRFGFAATLGRGTVLRGGFGLNFYPANYGSSAHFRNPPYVSLFSVATTPLTPINTLAEGLPLPVPTDPANPRGNLTAVALDFRSSYVQQYNLTLQRELAGDMVVSAGYVGALSRKQLSTPNVNLALPGAGAILPRRPYFSQFPNVNNITLVQTDSIANYHALQATLERRFSKGFTLMSNYTWAHAIDDTQTTAGGKPGNGPYPQLVNNRTLERASSDIDVRQRWVLMTAYELPFARNATGFAAQLVKGWQVNAVAVAQTGLTYSIANAASRANTGGGDRPHRIADGTLPEDQRSVNRWFDTSAFVPQPFFEIGNAGRNILYGPPQRQLDFSVFKDFTVTESSRVQFRAEVFNLTNTPNFGVPQQTLGTPDFGTINNTANAGPRQLQFALKLLF
jgi:hypothetical protein